jgi:hypothetical protein
MVSESAAIRLTPVVVSQPMQLDGPILAQLEARRRAEDPMSDEEWKHVLAGAARTFSECSGPLRGPGRVTGLALGKVQSGKTLSYTVVTALAADNGYKATVVLAGTKKPLLEQTSDRLRRDLGSDNVIVLVNPGPAEADVVESVIEGGSHALLVVLKHGKRIRELTRLLGSVRLRKLPILIIDDEGDEASLNTQFRRGVRSATYGTILELRAVLSSHAYIAYTATPQANLLISGLDVLSPDFGVLLEPGQGYCGGAIFFGDTRERYLRGIPSHEGEPERSSDITEALKRAMVFFFVAAATRSLLPLRARRLAMLVHTSDRRDEHRLLTQRIKTVIMLWRQMAVLPAPDPGGDELLRLVRSAYDDLSGTVARCPSFEDVRAQFTLELSQNEVWMVNSLPMGRDPIATALRLRNNILVGGNMLGRGVTVHGLAVTYITRQAQRETNADTLEQRSRWFGYKSDLGLCRIFLTERLADRYTELLRHEDDFWAALSRNELQGLPIKDWPRLFRLDVETWNLRPTRSSVANYRAFRAGQWEVQTTPTCDDRASSNVEIVRVFFRRHTGQMQGFGHVQHRVVSGISVETVIRDLLSALDDETTDWPQAYVVEYLSRLYVGGQLPTMDVLLMFDGKLRIRTQTATGSVNPMSGRSQGRVPGDPKFYPGDEHIHGGRVQLQVHVLAVYIGKRRLATTTALALYVPNCPEYDLKLITRGLRT